MAFTYTMGTDIARVRFRIADTVDAGHRLEDAEVQMALDAASGSIPHAAAVCLRAIAANAAKLELQLKVLDIDMDTRGYAKELRAQAAELEKRADDDGSFSIVEMASAGFGVAERLEKERQRNGE